MSMPLLQTVDLKKYFSTSSGQLHAVDGINISVDERQTLGVVGESGCGKSTLGRTILRLLPATSGKILFRGENILEKNTKEMKLMRQKMQMIFQDPYASLNPRLSISQIIAEPLQVNGIYKNRNELDERVNQLMDEVGLAIKLRNAYPHELDGGRRQRIGIARALALEPEFIVCDEPVSALDVSIQAQILNLMMDLQDNKGLTYMFITHDLSVVKHISNNIAVMYLGECVEIASPTELFSNAIHPYTQALLAAVPIPDTDLRGKPRNIIKGELTSPIDPKPCCRFAPRCPYAKPECFEKTFTLKEISEGHKVACILAE